MRNIILLSSLLFVQLAASAGVKIKGEVTNAGDNDQIYLYNIKVGHLSLMDSAKMKSGKFAFKFSDVPLGQYRIGFSATESAPVILSDENLDITATAGDFEKTFSCSDSRQNELFASYVKAMKAFETTANEIQMKARRVNPNDAKSNDQLMELQNEFNEAKEERDNVLRGFDNEYGQTYVGRCSEYILTVENQEEANFFNDFGNETLQRGDVLLQGLNVYFGKFLAGKSQGEIKAAIQGLPGRFETGSEKQEVMYLALIEWLKGMDARFAASIAKDYYRDFPNSPYEEELKNTLPALPPQVGDMAPDIAMNNPEGEEMKLSDLKGKVILLDFWASWCGPCRRENPNVVKTYEKYKDKGFTVFSVSLDKQANRWKGAIEKDNLVWENHVSDLRGWSSAAGKLYGVSSIPSTFLIDENGVIIAQNLRGHQLERKLQEIFGED